MARVEETKAAVARVEDAARSNLSVFHSMQGLASSLERELARPCIEESSSASLYPLELGHSHSLADFGHVDVAL